MIRLETMETGYQVYLDNQMIGTVHLWDNPCHGRNCYLNPELERMDVDFSAELFQKIGESVNRPLQVMTYSDNKTLTAFLVAGGFECRRKCYETEAGKDDYCGGEGSVQLQRSCVGEQDYGRCCRYMYERYLHTHEMINPWTADFAAFCQKMPGEVVYAKRNGRIEALAFTEDSEIAYVYGADKASFTDFARSLVSSMLARFQRVFFESDDCDWAAMTLRSMFRNQDNVSFDTYLREKRDTEMRFLQNGRNHSGSRVF